MGAHFIKHVFGKYGETMLDMVCESVHGPSMQVN